MHYSNEHTLPRYAKSLSFKIGKKKIIVLGEVNIRNIKYVHSTKNNFCSLVKKCGNPFLRICIQHLLSTIQSTYELHRNLYAGAEHFLGPELIQKLLRMLTTSLSAVALKAIDTSIDNLLSYPLGLISKLLIRSGPIFPSHTKTQQTAPSQRARRYLPVLQKVSNILSSMKILPQSAPMSVKCDAKGDRVRNGKINSSYKGLVFSIKYQSFKPV